MWIQGAEDSNVALDSDNSIYPPLRREKNTKGI